MSDNAKRYISGAFLLVVLISTVSIATGQPPTSDGFWAIVLAAVLAYILGGVFNE